MTKELKPLFDYLGSQIDPVLLLKAVEQNPASIVIMDPEGKMIYTNKKFKESTGYSAEEAYGQSLGLLMSDDGYTDYGAMWRSCFKGVSGAEISITERRMASSSGSGLHLTDFR